MCVCVGEGGGEGAPGVVCDKRIDVNIYRSHSHAMLSVRLQLQTSHELGIITSPSAYGEFERASRSFKVFRHQ